jgi:hypothetical protein
MNKLILLFLFFLLCTTSFSQIDDSEKIKARKLTYSDFIELSFNDTSSVVIDVFFLEKERAIYNQMSLFPLTLGLIAIPQTRLIGVGTAFISLPLFLNGNYLLIKYRKKKLYKVLINYKETRTLPMWVRKKSNKLLRRYAKLETYY